MKVTTIRNPEWIEWISPDILSDKDLVKIFVFFVLHSPCKTLSAMKKTLSEYGWATPWKKPYYLNKQLRQAASNYELLFSVSKYENMETALDKANLKDDFPSDYSYERICFYDSQKNQFMSVFYHIRNAFSHGRIKMVDVEGECVLILEDIASNGKNTNSMIVSARMIIRKSTLLKWIEIIENGESEYVQTTDKKRDEKIC